MSLNEKPCKDCYHYDRIIFGDDSTKTRMGWCAHKSIYPTMEQPGQLFPVGVKRVAPGELAKPVIVVGSEVIGHCDDFRTKL